MSERLYALRGATSVERNSAEAILAATEELMRELVARNELEIEQFVSCIFTATSDLERRVPGARRAAHRLRPRAAALHAARSRSPGRSSG